MNQSETTHPALDKYGRYYVAWMFIWPILQVLLFWMFAQRLDIPSLWLYFAANMLVLPLGHLIVARVNPEVINHRARRQKKTGTKTWDKVLIRFFGLFGFHLPIILAALDLGKFHWSTLPWPVWVFGVVLFVAGNAVFCWGMCVNRHFETMVRLQTDRGHAVITAGPYRYIRHPGYMGIILWILSMPLMLGSAVALIPAVIGCLLLVVRTWLEDTMLQKDLPGYADYAARVRYRLLWGIW